MDSTSIQELREVPEKLLVVGGRYIGLEFGQLFRRLGSQVSIVQRGRQLPPQEDVKIAEAMQKIMEEEGVEVILNDHANSIKVSNSDRFTPTQTCSIDGSKVDLEGSHILLATGRTPNTDTLHLDRAGVKLMLAATSKSPQRCRVLLHTSML